MVEEMTDEQQEQLKKKKKKKKKKKWATTHAWASVMLGVVVVLR